MAAMHRAWSQGLSTFPSLFEYLANLLSLFGSVIYLTPPSPPLLRFYFYPCLSHTSPLEPVLHPFWSCSYLLAFIWFVTTVKFPGNPPPPPPNNQDSTTTVLIVPQLFSGLHLWFNILVIFVMFCTFQKIFFQPWLLTSASFFKFQPPNRYNIPHV